MNDAEVPTTPLSVLLVLMREKWMAHDKDGAAALARAAAPYVHAKLAPTAAQTERIMEVHRLSDAELQREIALIRGGSPASDEDTDIPR